MFWKKRIQVDVNIDYDRLAEAIVKATKAEASQEEPTSQFLKLVLSIAFVCVGLVLIVTAGIGIKQMISNAHVVAEYAAYIFVIAVCALYGIIVIILARQIDKIKDKQYLVGFFSAIVAMTALIVTIVK